MDEIAALYKIKGKIIHYRGGSYEVESAVWCKTRGVTIFLRKSDKQWNCHITDATAARLKISILVIDE